MVSITKISEQHWDDSQNNELKFWSKIFNKCKGELSDRIFCYENVDTYKNLLGVTDNKIIIDVGAGPIGGILPTLKGKVKIGVDSLFMGYRKVGWEYNKIDFIPITACAENIPLVDDYADIVFCTNALDHMQNIGAVFCEMVRILKTKGRLFLAVNLREFENRTSCHKMCFDKTEINKLITENNMSLLHTHNEKIKGHPAAAATFVGIMEKL